MQVTNFCLLGMASLAELFPKGEVSWIGKATNQNEFEFRPTVNKEQLKAWMMAKTTSLERQWENKKEDWENAAW